MAEFKEFLVERDFKKEILSQNHNPNPTEKQIKSGNYAKPTIRAFGLVIKIEHPIGSKRRGVSPDGVKWETEFKNASYGEIRGTRASDGDSIDVFIANKDFQTERVWIVNQSIIPSQFDEVKVMLGFKNYEDAINAYLSNYEENWGNDHIMSVKEVSMKEFKEWLNYGDTKKPFHGGVDIWNA